MTAKHQGLKYPKVSIEGAGYSSVVPNSISNTETDFMHVDEPRLFVPYRVQYETINTPMWVRVTVIDESITQQVFMAEVKVGIGANGLFAERIQGVSSYVTLDINSTNLHERRTYIFQAYVTDRQMGPNEPIPPNVVGVRFVEVKESVWRKLTGRSKN